MTILIVYATNSSGTQSVSQLLGALLEKAGHRVTVVRASDAAPRDLLNYDAVLLGSCTWLGKGKGLAAEGQLQEHMSAFVEQAQLLDLAHKPCAVFGLGDSSYTHFCAAADHLEKFVQEHGGRLIVPSLRIDGYYFDRDQNDKLVNDWGQGVIHALST